jgi:hypothetical protein
LRLGFGGFQPFVPHAIGFHVGAKRVLEQSRRTIGVIGHESIVRQNLTLYGSTMRGNPTLVCG